MKNYIFKTDSEARMYTLNTLKLAVLAFFAESMHTFGPILSYFMVQLRNLKGVTGIVERKSKKVK